MGIISCLAESNSRFAQDEFFVVSTKANNLIGGNLALRLNLVNINVHQIGHNTTTYTSCENEFKSRLFKIPLRLHKDIKQFEHVFTGTGKLRNEKVKLHIDETVKPVAQKASRIPFHLRSQVDVELDRLRKSDVIEDITDEATPWVSPIVVLPKKANPYEIRMCIDMRQANKAIQRTRHPSPGIEDLIHDLNGATHFCKLDMNNAFLQLELDRDSRYITTFATHQGLHRYKRLNFGTTSASEELQIKLEKVLHNIKGCKNIADDIILFAKSQAELDNILKLVLQRIAEHGLTLNLEKCEFDKLQVEFFGYIFSANGVSPSPEKVKAIQQITSPINISETRSFLGMTNFLSRFIPNYSELSGPLRPLTKKVVPWVWGPEQQQSFEKLKCTLSSETVMSYFTPTKDTTIVTDAGPCGVSAILLQHSPNIEDYRVIAYSSRSLTDVERRYSQIEKECLAILHGCEKFNIYLAGSHFNILTDHKPLVSLLSNLNSVLPLRIERCCLRLQGYNYTIRHIKGNFNPADYCSRHTSVEINSIVGVITEEYVNFIAKHATPNAVTLQEIQSYTKLDPTLQALAKLIKCNTWHLLDNTPQTFSQYNITERHAYRKFYQEFTVNEDDSIILRRKRLVIPLPLRKRMLELAQETHLGVTKTKSILRDKVYFPGMDSQVESQLKSCLACAANSRTDPPPPLQPSTLPPSPWHTLNIDFLGPLPNRSYLLVVIDQRTRFPEVEVIGSTAAVPTLAALNKIFSTHGLPHKVISDNGSPFHSYQFKQYMKSKGIDHHRITPLHPKANSTAENFMRNLNKALRIAVIEQKPWKDALYDFILNYRIATHTTTQVSPAEALYQRKIRGKIPTINNTPNREAIQNLPHRDYESKQKIKSYIDRRYHARDSKIDLGDYVLVKQKKKDKLSSRFDSQPYRITQRRGTMLTGTRPGHSITRNIQHFKFLSKTEPGYRTE